MKTISQQELEALCQNGKAIDSKGGYPAVVLHPDGTVTKFWARKKGFFSSSTISPYSTRFIKNAAELTRRGVIAPEIISHAKLEHSHVRIVTYRSLPGESIRELLKENPTHVDIPRLAEYIFQLHEKGISFGGMHLGNIIQRPNDQGYGLIDFTDVKFYSKPVSLLRRAANLATPLRYQDDVKRITESGLPSLQQCYLDLLKLDEVNTQCFNDEVKRYLK
jgi:hypothetical protein